MIQTKKIETPAKLKKALGPIMLWGLGVGYVISGMYFGWNLGLPEGGSLGLAIATFFIIILYVTFTFSYTELACAIPKAGGVFDYASRAMGRRLGFIAGMAQIIEFVFAPPAIAAAIGAYFHIFFSQVPVNIIAITAYLLFTALNIYGIKAAAIFELVITVFAVFELLLFCGITFPHFHWSNITHNAFPNGWKGAWAATPFAIWFFLGLEGVANVAEETVNPQRNVLLGFGSALFTLIALCALVFLASIGVGGWEKVVYAVPGADASDSPLPLALAQITGNTGWLYHLLITIGLMGLIASFHGLILAASRATYEFGYAGCIPTIIGKIHPKFNTRKCITAEYVYWHYCLTNRQNRRCYYHCMLWCNCVIYFWNDQCIASKKKRTAAPPPFPYTFLPGLSIDRIGDCPVFFSSNDLFEY